MAGTFAPTKAIWSLDNRTAGYRVVADGTRLPEDVVSWEGYVDEEVRP